MKKTVRAAMLFVLCCCTSCADSTARIMEKERAAAETCGADKRELYMESFLPEDFFRRIESGNFQKCLYPSFDDRAAWERARGEKTKREMIESVMSMADNACKTPPPQLLFSNYRQFAVNGNRTEYQDPYFERRKRLGALVLALCISGEKERYLTPLFDEITAILEESTWCLPAHAQWHGTTPDNVYQADLFACETGAQLALTVNVLGALLDREYPGLTDRIRETVLDRTVRTVFSPVSRKLCLWFDTEEPGNWTPWCSYNCLVIALCLEKDPVRLAFVIREFLRPVSRFASYYDDSGFCEEGPSYFYNAGGMMFHASALLEKMVPGSMKTFYQSPKNRAVFEFIAHLRIADDMFSFADSTPERNPKLSMLLPCAAALNSEPLFRFCRNTGFKLHLYNGALLHDNLAVLFDCPPEIPAQENAEESVSFYADRLAVMRSERFSAAIKAGHNAEPHGHNDLGNFVLYSGNRPVIVDAGTATYTQINFSPLRYTLWYTRGSGHNAPVIGGTEQQEGRKYSAKLPKPERKADGSLEAVCDLKNAYPPETGVKNFVRKMLFSPGRVEVQDIFELSGKQEMEISLLTPEKVTLHDGCIQLGNTKLQLEKISFVRLETTPQLFFGGAERRVWPVPLNRIVLKGSDSGYRLIFTGLDVAGVK